MLSRSDIDRRLTTDFIKNKTAEVLETEQEERVDRLQ